MSEQEGPHFGSFGAAVVSLTGCAARGFLFRPFFGASESLIDAKRDDGLHLCSPQISSCLNLLVTIPLVSVGCHCSSHLAMPSHCDLTLSTNADADVEAACRVLCKKTGQGPASSPVFIVIFLIKA